MSDYVASITRGEETQYFETFTAANTAAQDGDTIKLLVSELSVSDVKIINLKAGVTLEGVEGCTTIDGQQGGGSFKGNVVFKNIIFTNSTGNNALRNCYSSNGPVSFINCTFDANTYGCHFDQTKNDVSFTDCTFTGWNSFGSGDATITFTDCTFDKSPSYATVRPYVNTVMTGCVITEDFIEKGNGGVDSYGSSKSLQLNNCTIVDADGNPSTTYTVEDALRGSSDTNAFVIDGVQDAEGKFTAGKVIANNVSTAKNFVADDISFIPDTLGAISYDIDSSTIEVKDALSADITLPEGTNLTLDNGVAEGVKIYLPYEPGSEEEAAWLAANDTVPVEDIQAYVAMIGDKGYYSFADANAAAQAGDTIKLLVSELTKDEINVINLKAGVTLEGVEGCTTIKGQQGGASFKANIVIKNIIFSNPGGYGLRNCYSSNGPVSFENCTFDAWAYGVHFDGLKNDVSFTDCNFKGWNSFADNGGKLYFTNCTFDTGTDFAELRPYGNTVMTGCSITEAFVEKGKSGDMGLESTGSNRLFQIDDCTIIDADGNPSTKYAVDDAVNYVSSTSAFAIDAEQDAEGKFTSGTIIGGKLATVNGFVADEIKIDFLSDENYADTGSVNYTATASGKTLSLGGTVTNSVNVPADVVINQITLEDGAHLTLNSKDSLAVGDYAFGPDSIIFINEDMSAEEIAAWKTAHGIDESVELLLLAGSIGAPEADTVVPVSATEQNSYKSHIVNLGVDETLTEDLVAPAAAEIIGQETEGGVTTTFINPVGTIFLNNQGGAYAEVRGNVTQNSTAEAIVVNNVTAAANADDNGGFATVAGQMNITGNLTAAGQITVRNGENATMAMRDTVMEKEGYLLQAANVVIENDGDMVANISAVDTVAIHNTGILAGTVNGVEITIDCEGTFEDANITAADANGNGELSITADQILVGTTLTADSFWLDEEIVIVMDKDSVITYNVEFINDGTITVDMTGATEASYLIVANLSGDNVKVRDFDDVRLINGSGYMLTVLNRQNLIALKSDASQEVFKVSAAWKDYEVGQAIEGQDGFIYGFNAFSNLNDASRSLTADTTAIDAVNHTATEGLSERINVIDRTLTFSGSSDLPATGEIAISTDSESAASAIFAAGSDYSFSKVTFVDAAGKNSLFIGAADGDATTFGVGTIADTVGDTVKIVNATVTAGSYTVNGTDNTIDDVEMTAENLTVAAGAVFGVSDSAVTATAASSNAGTIRLSDSIFSAAALENNGTIILNGTNLIDAALSGNGEIEINADAVIGDAEHLSSITDTGSNSLIFKGIATIVGSITVGSDILLDRSGASTEVDVTGTLLTNGNFTLGGNDTFEDYLYVDGLGSSAGSLLGDLVISEDCEVSLSNGATLTYAGDFTNNGKISYSVKSPTLLTYTLIDYVGNGVKTIDDYDLSKITLSKSLKDYTVIASEGDLVAAKIDTSAIHVDAAWAGSSKGDIVKDAQNNEYVYGYNAFAQLAEFIPTFNGGDIVAHEAGNVASTETTAGEGIEINNPGTYNLAGAEWTNVGYLQLNAAKAALSTHVVVNIDNANLVATKIQARRDADFVITDSHLDFENVTASRGYTCIYANSTLTLNNSVYGYNHYSGNSSAIVAGRAGIVEGQIQPTDNYGKTAVQIDGKLIANNSTLFTVTGDDTVGFGVQDKGYVELTDSVLYAGAIAIGVNQTDAKKKSENTGVDVATLVLDNSVQIRQNADNYKIEVGKEVAGALIVRNNSLIDRADAPMTVSGGSSVDISSSTVKVSALTNNGTITLDTASLITATSMDNGNGTITIDATGLAANTVKKVIDLNQAAVLANVTCNAGESGAKLALGSDGDVVVHNIDQDIVYVNSAWTGYSVGDVIETGKYYGINAFSAYTPAYDAVDDNGTITICSDVDGSGVAAVTTKSLTFQGTGNIDLDNTVQINGTWTVNSNANIGFAASDWTHGLNIRSDGTLTVTGGATADVGYLINRGDIEVSNDATLKIYYGLLYGRKSTAGEASQITVDNAQIVFDSNTYNLEGHFGNTAATDGVTNVVLTNGKIIALDTVTPGLVFDATAMVTATATAGNKSEITAATKITNSGTLNLASTDVTANTIENAGAITLDVASSITAGSLANGNGTITIDATGLAANTVKKVIDLNQAAALANVTINSGESGAKLALGSDGDVVVHNIDQTNLYVNRSWAGSQIGAEVGGEDSGKYYDINAFSAINDATKIIAPETATTITLSGTEVLSSTASFSNGQNVTLTGTATINWKAGWLFVGRGIADADRDKVTTVTIKDADFSWSEPKTPNASTGIHVSGYDRTSSTTNYGVLRIEDSSVECDYLIDRNEVTISNSTVELVNMYVHGRNAAESKSGTDETATLTIEENSTVTLKYANGLYLGAESYGVIDVDSSAFNITDTGAWTITSKGTVNLKSGNMTAAGSIANNGTITLSGASKLAGTITGAGTLKFDGATIADAIAASTNAGEFSGTNTINAALSLASGKFTGTNTINANVTFATDYKQGYKPDFSAAASTVTFHDADLTAKNFYIGSDESDGVTDTLVIDGGALKSSAPGDTTAIYVRNNGVLNLTNGATLGNYSGNVVNLMDYNTVSLAGTSEKRAKAYLRSLVVYAGDFDDTKAVKTTAATFTATNADIDVKSGNAGNEYTIVDGFKTQTLVGGKSGKGDGTMTLTSSTLTVGIADEGKPGNFAIGFVEDGSVTMSDGSTLSVANGTIGIGLSTGTGLLDVSADSTVTANAITFGDNGSINLTIDASALTETTYKLIDITGTQALDTAKITVNGTDAFVDGATYGDYTLKLWDGDVVLSKVTADMSTLYVNAAWTGTAYGTDLGDGKYYGINAFDNIDNVFALYGDKEHSNTETTEVVLLSDVTAAATGKKFFYSDVDVAFTAASDVVVDMTSYDRAYLMHYYPIENYQGAPTYVPTFTIGDNVTFRAKLVEAGQVVDSGDVDAQGNAKRDPGAANILVNGRVEAKQTNARPYSKITTGTNGVITTHPTLGGSEMVIRSSGEIDINGDGSFSTVQFSPNYVSNQGGTLKLKDAKGITGSLIMYNAQSDLDSFATNALIELDNSKLYSYTTSSFAFAVSNSTRDTNVTLNLKNGSELSGINKTSGETGLGMAGTNKGAINVLTGSKLFLGNVTNTGTIMVDGASTIVGTATLTNTGLISVSASTLSVTTVTTTDGTFTVSGTSLLTIGTLTGTITVDGDANLTGSSVGGAGDIAVAAGKVLTVGDATEMATSFGAVTNSGTIVLDGALVNLGAITNNGTINMDWQDKLTFSGFTGSAINFDMTGYTGVETATKVMDYTGTEMTEADYQAMLGIDATKFSKYFELGAGDDANDLFLKAGVTDNIYIQADGTQEDVSHYTVSHLQSAVAKAKEDDASITVLNGTFNSLAEFQDVVTVIEDGVFNKNIAAGETVTAASARKKVTIGEDEDVDMNLTINDGSYKYVYGADRLTLGSLDHFGSVNLTINGGTFEKAVVGGIAYAQTSTSATADLIGDINLTITGGTFKEYVYGGCIASSKNLGSRTTIEGDITMTIDVAEGKTVTFEKNIIVGSMGSGYVSKNLDTSDGGNVELVLSGAGTITLTGETSQIWGGCSSDQYFTNSSTGARRFETNIEGNRTLTFTGFTGTLDCNTIRGFNVFNATDSNFTLNDGVNLNDIINWDISADSTISGNFYSNFAGDTLNVGLANWDNEAKAIFDDASKFSGMDENLTVTFGDAVASYQDGVWTAAEAGVKLYLEDNKVMLGIA